MAETNVQQDASNKVFTIPNLITMLRVVLIPVFTILFLQGHLLAMLIVLAISGLSDTVDGKIARRFHMVSNIGKWLDPAADKLTQITLAVLLFVRFNQSADAGMKAFSWVFLLFLGKELLMLLVALLMLLLKKRPAAAEIYGKAATMVFYVVMTLLFLAGPDVSLFAHYGWPVLPNAVVMALVVLTLLLTFIAFFSYIPDTYRKLFNKEKKK
ncbi:MAG: CDP-alcohol phosphatidyltransferase family protein [Oscillospiraceae bacterium]|jgi:cardiolipin synthase|nr:CDP-alcohol phosphatidyltransferase family protein [Oscillospiraceae bacterium]